MAINFKDVGVIKDLGQSFQERNATQRPINIKTPLEFDTAGNNVFKTNDNLRDAIKDNLRNLILTNHGERLALTMFGANLKPLTTEFPNTDDFEQEAAIRINTAVNQWLPFVDLIDLDTSADIEGNQDTGIIILTITYGIPSLNVFNEKLEVRLFII